MEKLKSLKRLSVGPHTSLFTCIAPWNVDIFSHNSLFKLFLHAYALPFLHILFLQYLPILLPFNDSQTNVEVVIFIPHGCIPTYPKIFLFMLSFAINESFSECTLTQFRRGFDMAFLDFEGLLYV